MKMKMNNSKALVAVISVMLAVVFVFSAVNLAASDSEAEDLVYEISLPAGAIYDYTTTILEYDAEEHGNLTFEMVDADGNPVTDGTYATNDGRISAEFTVDDTSQGHLVVTAVPLNSDEGYDTPTTQELTLTLRATPQYGADVNTVEQKMIFSVVAPVEDTYALTDVKNIIANGTAQGIATLPTASEGSTYTWAIKEGQTGFGFDDPSNPTKVMGTFSSVTADDVPDQKTVMLVLTISDGLDDDEQTIPDRTFDVSVPFMLYAELEDISGDYTYSAFGADGEDYEAPIIGYTDSDLTYAVESFIVGGQNADLSTYGISYTDGTFSGHYATGSVSGTVTVKVSTTGNGVPQQSKSFDVIIKSEPKLTITPVTHTVYTGLNAQAQEVVYTVPSNLSTVTWSTSEQGTDKIKFGEATNGDGGLQNTLTVNGDAANDTDVEYIIKVKTELQDEVSATLTVKKESLTFTVPDIAISSQGSNKDATVTISGDTGVGTNFDWEVRKNGTKIDGITVTSEDTKAKFSITPTQASTYNGELILVATSKATGIEYSMPFTVYYISTDVSVQKVETVVNGGDKEQQFTVKVNYVDYTVSNDEGAPAMKWTMTPTDNASLSIGENTGAFRLIDDVKMGSTTVEISATFDNGTEDTSDDATLTWTFSCQVFTKLAFDKTPYNGTITYTIS